MSRKFNKKSVLATLGVVGVLAIAGAAFAYFTASGTGGGTASVGTSSTVNLAGTISGTLYPGGSAAGVSVVVTNEGAGSQHVASVSLASVAIDHNSTTYTGTTDAQKALWDACNVTSNSANSAFTMSDITVNHTYTKHGTAGDNSTVTGSLQMNDTGVSQDNCQGAPLALTFSSN
jgi:hypothetical protein